MEIGKDLGNVDKFWKVVEGLRRRDGGGEGG